MMTRVLTLLALAAATLLGASDALDREWARDTAEDKRGHFALGLSLGMLGAEFVGRPYQAAHPILGRLLALAPAALVGVGKEIYDAEHRDRHSPEVRDAAATLIGGLVGVAVVYRF